jgi:hypothetical protein
MTMVYDLPIADTTAQPMAQVQGFTAPDSKDFSSAQLQEGGAALTKAGIATTQIVKTIQDDIDTATTKEMDNKLADAIRVTLYDPEKGYLKTPGKRALESRPGAIKDIQDAAKEIESGLQNDVQRYMFKKAAMVRMQSAMLHIDSHAMQQAKVYAGAEAKARMDGARLDAIADSANWKDPNSQYARSEKLVKMEVGEMAKLAGIPENSAQYAHFMQAATTQVAMGVIDQMLSRDKVADANEYFKTAMENKNILPDMEDNIRTKLNVAVDHMDGKNAADLVFGELMKGVTVNSAIPEEAMYKAIEGSESLTTRGKEFAKAKLHDNISRYTAQKRQAEEGASNQVFGMMKNDGNRSEYQKVLYAINQLGVDDKAKFNLRSAADHFYHISEDRQTAKLEDKMRQDVQNLGRLLQFQNDYAEGKLGKLTPQDMGKYISTFGSFTDDAMRFVNHANDLADNVNLTTDQLKDELRIMKLNPAYKYLSAIPNPDSKDPSDHADLALLQSRVVELIATSGKAGKQRTVQQALATALHPYITDKGLIWDSKSPAYKLGTIGLDNPKNWGDDAKTNYINTQFYLLNGRLPSAEEFKPLKLKLEQ